MMKTAPFVSSRAARVKLDVTAQASATQARLLLQMGETVNDHAAHIQGLEDERTRLTGWRARLTWLWTGR